MEDDNNIIEYKDLKKNITYYLTGEFWKNSECMIGTPVTLVRFETNTGNKTKAKSAYVAVLKTDDGDLVNVYTMLFKN